MRCLRFLTASTLLARVRSEAYTAKGTLDLLGLFVEGGRGLTVVFVTCAPEAA